MAGREPGAADGGVNAAVHDATVAAARDYLTDLLDASEAGVPAAIQRDRRRHAIVDAERLRHALATLVDPDVQLVNESGGWAAFVPGLPISASGATIDEAVDDLVEAVREYAEVWIDHLRLASNHRENWDFVQIVDLSDDDQLRAWLVG